MSGPTSTFGAAKLALFNLLKVAPGYAGIQVSYGDPGLPRLERQAVWLGGTTADGRTWAPYGQLRIEEEYGIEFFVHVAIPGGTQQEATEQALALFDVGAAIVRPLSRNCGTTVTAGMHNLDMQQLHVVEFVTDQGHTCFINGEINCKARI